MSEAEREKPWRRTRRLREERQRVLWEEYKLLQGKLDALGQFRFSTKGWCVTLAGGLTAGGAAYDIPWMITSCAGLLLILAFLLIERHQLMSHRSFTARIFAVERELREVGVGGPGIAAAIKKGHRARVPWYRLIRRLERNANGAFFVILLGLVAVVPYFARADSKEASRLDDGVAAFRRAFEAAKGGTR